MLYLLTFRLAKRIQRFNILLDNLFELDCGDYLIIPHQHEKILQIVKERSNQQNIEEENEEPKSFGIGDNLFGPDDAYVVNSISPLLIF